MTEALQITLARAILETQLVEKVYHNCQMLRNQQNERLYPAYKQGAEFLYAGIDDRKGLFAYIRTNGEMVARAEPMASCEKTWNITAPLRVVFFSDNEKRDHGWLLKHLATFTFGQWVTLQRIIEDKWRLIQEESDLTRGRFDGWTFYVAFDVLVNFVISDDACQQAACTAEPNPLCL